MPIGRFLGGRVRLGHPLSSMWLLGLSQAPPCNATPVSYAAECEWGNREEVVDAKQTRHLTVHCDPLQSVQRQRRQLKQLLPSVHRPTAVGWSPTAVGRPPNCRRSEAHCLRFTARCARPIVSSSAMAYVGSCRVTSDVDVAGPLRSLLLVLLLPSSALCLSCSGPSAGGGGDAQPHPQRPTTGNESHRVAGLSPPTTPATLIEPEQASSDPRSPPIECCPTFMSALTTVTRHYQQLLKDSPLGRQRPIGPFFHP